MPQAFDLQNAFNSGELSPLLIGRGDIPAYHSGLRLCQNYYVLRGGGLEYRPGFRFVAELKDSTKEGRIVRFQYAEDQAYVLELTENLMRVYTQQAIVLMTAHLIDCSDQVNTTTDELTFDNHGYWHAAGPVRVAATTGSTLPTGLVAGQDYYVVLPTTSICTQSSGVDTTNDIITVDSAHEYSSELGPFWVASTSALPTGLSPETDYYIRNPTSTTFELSLTPGGAKVTLSAAGSGIMTIKPTDLARRTNFRLRIGTSAPIDITGTGSGHFTVTPQGTIPAEFEFPFTESQLFQLQFAQQGDTLYVTHPDQGIVIRKLERYASYCWQMQEPSLEDGPYMDEQMVTSRDYKPAVTMTPGAATGNGITMTASEAVFRATDVGRPIGYATDARNWGWGRIVGVQPLAFDYLDVEILEVDDVDINPGADEVTGLTIPWDHGEGPIQVDASDYGFVTGTNYWVNKITATRASFHLTEADALADTNRVDLDSVAGAPILLVSAWINVNAHGFTANDGPVTLSTTGALPDGLTLGTNYFIKVLDVNHFGFSLTLGGTIVSLYGTGSGASLVHGTTLPSTTAIVDIKRDFDTPAASLFWRLGSFSAASDIGFPAACTFHEQRLVLGGNVGDPQRLYASQPGLYETFSPDEELLETSPPTPPNRILTDASSYQYVLSSEDRNQILWLSSIQQLIAGTLGGVFGVQATTLNESITPSNVNAKRVFKIGTKNVEPAVLGDAIFFVERDGRGLRAARYDENLLSVVPSDVMVLAEHLGWKGTIAQLADLPDRLQMVWAARSDGQLLGLVFDTQQQIQAWSRVVAGGTDAEIESVASVPGADHEETWVLAKRTIDGVTKRYVEYQGPRHNDESDITESVFLDSAIYQDLGSPSSSDLTVSHLEGETVTIVGDGMVQGTRVVSGGVVTPYSAATRFSVGLAYQSIGYLLPSEIKGQEQLGIGMRNKRTIEASLRIHNTATIAVGPSLDKMVPLLHHARGDLMDTPLDLVTGVLTVPIEAGYDKDGGYYFTQDYPLPQQVLAALSRIEIVQR